MKSITTFFVMILILVAASAAIAFGPKSMDSQQVKGDFVLPNPARSTCTDIPIGRDGSVTVTAPITNKALWIDWQTFVKSTGVAVAVKRSFNSNTAYRVSTGRADALHPNVTSVKFTNFTTATVHTVCYDASN